MLPTGGKGEGKGAGSGVELTLRREPVETTGSRMSDPLE
jgi:hypothetical protein